MRVDVHTHVWPDAIAPIVEKHATCDLKLDMPLPNTVSGLKAHMEDSGWDKSVVVGIAERPDQVAGVNDWLISVQDRSIISFGAIHPLLKDKPAEIRRIRSQGLKGIKLHPVLNRFHPDAPSMFPLYEEIGDSMVVAIHCGSMPHLRNQRPDFAAPHRIAAVARQFPRLKIIAFHLGGFYMLDEAEKHLVGLPNVLIDTSWPPTVKEIAPDTLLNIVNNHGADKVCFGTDYPFASQSSDAEYLDSLPLASTQLDMLLGANAAAFIGL